MNTIPPLCVDGNFDPGLQWARKAASELLQHIKCVGINTDLEQACRLRQINPNFKYRKMKRCIAMLEVVTSGFQIILNSDCIIQDDKVGRTLFSIAHEIGHTYFYNLRTSPPTKLHQFKLPSKTEEILCDLFAAELIMPRDIIMRHFSDATPDNHEKNFISYIKLRDKLHVSRQALAIRVIDNLSIFPSLLLFVQYRGRQKESPQVQPFSWRLLWHVKPPVISKELFIPRINNKYNIWPSAKWQILDSLNRQNKSGSIVREKIPKSQNTKIGNLYKIHSKLTNCDDSMSALFFNEYNPICYISDNIRQSGNNQFGDNFIVSIDFSDIL